MRRAAAALHVNKLSSISANAVHQRYFGPPRVLWFVSSYVTNCHLGFSLASSVSRMCVGVRVPWLVCNSCVFQVLIAVKCAVAGSLIATGV
jgi:hypothetical protein